MYKANCLFSVESNKAANIVFDVVFDKSNVPASNPSWDDTRGMNIIILKTIDSIVSNNFEIHSFEIKLDTNNIHTFIYPTIKDFKSAIQSFLANGISSLNIIINLKINHSYGQIKTFDLTLAYLTNYLIAADGMEFKVDLNLSSMTLESLILSNSASAVEYSDRIAYKATLTDCYLAYATIEYINRIELFGSDVILVSHDFLVADDTEGDVENFADNSALHNEYLQYVVLGTLKDAHTAITNFINNYSNNNFVEPNIVYAIKFDNYFKKIYRVSYYVDGDSSLLAVNDVLGLAAPYYGSCSLISMIGLRESYIPKQYIPTDFISHTNDCYTDSYGVLDTRNLFTKFVFIREFVSFCKNESTRALLFRHFPILKININILDDIIKSC